MEVSSSNNNRKKKYKMCEATSLTDLDKLDSSQNHKHRNSAHDPLQPPKQNQVGTVMLFGVPIVSLVMDGKERLCLAQISSTLLKEFSYNEIHNRRVALGITCIQCTPVQLEILRRAGAMPVTSRRCGMITRREAERLCQSFLGDHAPPQLPENFAFDVYHECAWGCRGAFVPSRYNSSRAKCIRCSFCQLFFSPNKFIFHSHRLPDSRYVQPDAANFNSWRRHLKLCGDPPDEVSLSPTPCPTFSPDDDDSRSKLPGTLATAQIVHAWEDVKAMFNGGTRKRLLAAHSAPTVRQQHPRPLSNNTGLKTATPNSSSSSSPGNNNNTTSNSSSSRAVTPQTTRQGTSFSQHGCGDLSSMAGGSQSFTNPTTPLLSSASRLDIWNPGISSAAAAAAAAAAVAARQCQLNPSAGANTNPTLPPLPFHPLSIPWLRRPLFPFSHPFGPTCKLFGENGNGMIPGADGLLASPLAGRQSQVQGQGISSAFKPVGSTRGSEQLLSWFNSHALHNGGNPLHPTLPEDLSTGSHHAHPCPELHPQASPLHQLHSKNNSLAYSQLNPLNAQDSMKEMLLGSLQSDIPAGAIQDSKKNQVSDDCGKIVNNNSRNNARNDEESDDEENVDIESTELDREESFNATSNGSYPTLWINNLNSHTINSNIRRLKRSIMQSDEANALTEGCHNNNNNKETDRASPRNNKTNGGGVNKKKRLWDCDKRTINSASSFCKDNAKQEIAVTSSGSSSRSNSATPELLSLAGSKEGQVIVAK